VADELELWNVDMTTDKTKNSEPVTFTFGDSESISGDRISDYIQTLHNGEYYEPPINMNDLYKIYRGSVFHSSAIGLKANILLSTLEPNTKISNTDFLRFTLEYLVYANGYLEKIDNTFGQPIRYKPSPAMRTRKKLNERFIYLKPGEKNHEFDKDKIFHLMQPDIKQEIYGVPDYMASTISSELNKEATLFRLRYYRNGTHAGYIIYMTDAAYNEDDIEQLQEKLKQSKGPGNFKNLFVYAPDGKKDGIQLIPISEVAAKDEFTRIKDTSREDELGMHRVPAQLIGVVPKNTGGFGAVGAASEVFARNEIVPLQDRFKEVNEWAGEELFKFKSYEIKTDEEPNPQ